MILSRPSQRSKNVKRFVYMSSAQAMLGNEDIFHVYTEVCLSQLSGIHRI